MGQVRPSTLEDFERAEEAVAEFAEWAKKHLGGSTLSAAARNRLKFLVVSSASGEPCAMRLAVSEGSGKVSIEFESGAA